MSANFNELERMSRLLAGVSALVSFFVLFFLFVFWMSRAGGLSWETDENPYCNDNALQLSSIVL